MEELRVDGDPVFIDDVILRTPGLSGQARSIYPTPAGMRARGDWTGDLVTALDRSDVETQVVIEMTDTTEEPLPPGGSRSTEYAESAMEVTVPAPSSGWGQMIVYTDESGVTTWEFATPAEEESEDATRGTGERTYLIRKKVQPAGNTAATRGVISSIGKKLLGVLVFRLVDPIFGEVGEYFAEKWERLKRPYRIRDFTPDNYRDEQGADLDTDGWRALSGNGSGGRALLFVHGTFSRAHTCFSRTDPQVMAELHRMYEGRVFAFDHFTLSHDPERNVEWFLTQIPDGTHLELDIVCHSRGGLVSRTLAEKQSEFSLGARRLSVGKILFVASPNAGTVLVDSKHMGSFIDSYTNVFNFFPDNGVTETLEGVVTVAKQLAVGVLKGLDGLQSMLPGGRFLTWLNTLATNESSYYALAGNYEPDEAGWKAWAADRLMDKIFENHGNDLVVPTEGVFESNGSNLFPIHQRVVYGQSDGINHSAFFGHAPSQTQILDWLRA